MERWPLPVVSLRGGLHRGAWEPWQGSSPCHPPDSGIPNIYIYIYIYACIPKNIYAYPAYSSSSLKISHQTSEPQPRSLSEQPFRVVSGCLSSANCQTRPWPQTPSSIGLCMSCICNKATLTAATSRWERRPDFPSHAWKRAPIVILEPFTLPYQTSQIQILVVGIPAGCQCYLLQHIALRVQISHQKVSTQHHDYCSYRNSTYPILGFCGDPVSFCRFGKKGLQFTAAAKLYLGGF